MPKTSILIVIIIVSLWVVPSVRGSSYVLPYPSYMPGNKLYLIARALDVVEGFWHFGSIASAKYHLGLADKYLVESKTLFEYKQYVLAFDALDRSDDHFGRVLPYLKRAKEEGKSISKLETTVEEAAEMHVAVMNELKSKLPKEFVWAPEKKPSTTLSIGDRITQSILLREETTQALHNTIK